MAAPEYEPQPQQPNVSPEVQQYPEQSEIPAHIEQAGVQSVPHSPATLQDQDTGQIVAQNTNMQPPVPIPDTPEHIHEWTKGNPADTRTWNGVFFEKVIDQAKILGRKLLIGNSSNA